MKHRSILQQVYSKQQQKKITEKKGNLPFFFKWLLIGALTTSIGLAVIVVLYIRKKGAYTIRQKATDVFEYQCLRFFRSANLSVDSTTSNPTTVTSKIVFSRTTSFV